MLFSFTLVHTVDSSVQTAEAVAVDVLYAYFNPAAKAHEYKGHDELVLDFNSKARVVS